MNSRRIDITAAAARAAAVQHHDVTEQEQQVKTEKTTKKTTEKRKSASPKPPVRAKTKKAKPEAPAPEKNEYRTSIFGLSSTLKKALEHAKLEDKVDAVVRIRAMVEIWQSSTPIQRELLKHPRASHRDNQRVEVTMPPSMWRALNLAAIDDRIKTIARLRGLIDMWHTDPDFAKRVDKLAKQRNQELIRHRWSSEDERRAEQSRPSKKKTT